VPPETSGFPKQMNGEERPGRLAAADDDDVTVPEAR
jgi:hypothetical protein